MEPGFHEWCEMDFATIHSIFAPQRHLFGLSLFGVLFVFVFTFFLPKFLLVPPFCGSPTCGSPNGGSPIFDPTTTPLPPKQPGRSSTSAPGAWTSPRCARRHLGLFRKAWKRRRFLFFSFFLLCFFPSVVFLGAGGGGGACLLSFLFSRVCGGGEGILFWVPGHFCGASSKNVFFFFPFGCLFGAEKGTS